MAKVRLSATVTDMFLSPRGRESLCEQHISALLEEPLGKINIFIVNSGNGIVLTGILSIEEDFSTKHCMGRLFS